MVKCVATFLSPPASGRRCSEAWYSEACGLYDAIEAQLPSVLRLAAEPDGDAECLVAVGAPVAGPWAKRLGHNGFVVAVDEEAAAAALARYERDGPRFGQS